MKKVHFLHIPKTAGQSVHVMLKKSFKSVSPLRLNAQYEELGNDSVQNYDVISGHIDWDLMEKGGKAEFTFTVLRDPVDRILSFYHYLRSEAQKLDEETLKSPEKIGMYNALYLSPDEYFCPKSTEFKKFIDDHYDNFYSYYFYSKTYSGNRKFKGKFSENEIIGGAIKNLLSLNKVYTLSTIYLLSHDLSKVFPEYDFEELLHVNKGDSLNTDGRFSKLIEIGKSELAIKRIQEMCSMDNYIFNLFK